MNGSAFDPSKMTDEELDQALGGSNAFDPSQMSDEELDAALASVEPVVEKSFLSGALDAGKAALRSAGDAALFGYSPQINAAIEPVVSAMFGGDTTDAKLRAQGFKVENPDYTQRRDAVSADLAQMAEQNPIASTLGGIAGAVAIPGAATTKGIAKLAPSLVKAAQTSGKARAGLAALGGGLGGAVINPGDVEGELDPLQIEERLKSAGFGTLAGLGGSYIAEKLPKVAEALKKIAERSGFKSLGPLGRDVIKANKDIVTQGKDLTDKEVVNKLERVGRTLLDEKIITGKPKSYEELADTIRSKVGPRGKEIGNLIDKYETKLLAGELSGIDRASIADDVSKALISGTDEPIFAAKNNYFRSRIEQFAGNNRGDLGIKQAQELRNQLNKDINWKRLPDADIPESEKFDRALYGALGKSIEDKIEAAAAKSGGGDLEKYKKLKGIYEDLKTAQEIASKKESREFANRFISPSDYGTGLVGGAVGFMQGDDLESKLKYGALGLTAGALNRYGRTKGQQVISKGSDTMARLIGKSETLRKAYQQDPNKVLAAFNQITGQFKKNDPEQRQESKPIMSEYVDPNQSAKMFLDNSSF